MKISSAINGFALYCAACGLKKKTTIGRTNKLEKLITFLGDVQIENVTTKDLQNFLNWLKTDYKPTRIGSKYQTKGKLSKRGIYHHHQALQSFYKWAQCDPDQLGYGLGINNAAESLPTPKFNQTQVEPFTEKEIKSLLQAIKPNKPKIRKGGKLYISQLGFQAAILTMLDVGLRRGELLRLKVADWQASTGRLHIIQGKGDKDRFVYVGAKTQHAIWFYLEQRQPPKITNALFATIQGGFYNHDHFRMKIREYGAKAGIADCHPHRFRHTCALLRIKNGETAESLQHLLGHTTPKMAMYYVKLAALDLEEIQKNASPIDNLIY